MGYQGLAGGTINSDVQVAMLALRLALSMQNQLDRYIAKFRPWHEFLVNGKNRIKYPLHASYKLEMRLGANGIYRSSKSILGCQFYAKLVVEVHIIPYID